MHDGPSVQCPSCGAPLPARNPGIVTGVCEHCDTVLTWDADAVQDSGRRSRLPQGFTRLWTGATGHLEGRRFEVLGRVRYGWGRGFWDEWVLRMEAPADADSDQPVFVWLTEDDHELAVEVGRGRMPLGEPERLGPGQRVEAQGRHFVVEEVGEAECVAVEGQLPERYELGERYRYADGSSPDGRDTIGIEWDEDEPMVFVGHWLKPARLELDFEGEPW